MSQELGTATRRTRAWACYDCGKCTASCPIARVGGSLSPRRHVLAANLGKDQDLLGDKTLFSCLTCALCSERCPAQVAYTDLVLGLRMMAKREGVEPDCPHGGALQSLMRMMARGGMKQDRLQWLTDEFETVPETADVFYWTGCTMYFDALFTDFPVQTLAGTRSALALLNRLGIRPVVSSDERCCGHDLLWNGDLENFELLAKHNAELVARSRASLLLTSCAECARTWSINYGPYFEGKLPQIQHISEFLAEHLTDIRPRSAETMRVTYQDPCRMGRHLGIYDPPRELLRSQNVEVVEMPRNRAGAVCCAGGTWSNCDRFAKRIQVERLLEARRTGAKTLVTTCPKCQIHLRCAMKDPRLEEEIAIETMDLAELVLVRCSDGHEPTGKKEVSGKEVNP